MTTVAVKPELLRWAVRRSGLPVDNLVQKYPKLNDWLDGTRQPTFRQLEQFARTTMTPFGTMFLDEPPVEKLPVPDFRTKNNSAVRSFSSNLIETIQTMQQRQDGVFNLIFVQVLIPQQHPQRRVDLLELGGFFRELSGAFDDLGLHLFVGSS